jgi:uncharacterized membrane protein YhdT
MFLNHFSCTYLPVNFWAICEVFWKIIFHISQ